MGAAPSSLASTTSLAPSSTPFLSTSSLVATSTAAAVSSTITSSSSSSAVSSISTTSIAQPVQTGPYLPIPYRDPSIAAAPPSRKDIDTLSNVELTLFVLAMQQWQQASASNVGGYFQVAGIHGAPHQYWDNAGGYQTTSAGNKNGGYCFHGDQNFYLWHRPYLALVEQQMVAAAINISNNWYAPQRATYQAAAASLKFPYWDWAKSGAVPNSIGNQQITVNDPATGQAKTITNPLYGHTLVSGGSLGTSGSGRAINVCSSNARTTCRGSNYRTNMQNAGASLKRNTALLFNTANVCWNVFATYNTDEQQQCSGTTNIQSLEGIHNTVHNTISGTMANLDTAAFDPIFWLHHCNVDRIGAIWQAINPDTTVDVTTGSDSTFVVGPGDRGDDFNYLPFRASQGNTDWWRVNELYDVRTSGYTYPEIADQPSASTALSRVNAIYGTGRTQQSVSAVASKHKRAGRLDIIKARQANDNTILVEPPSAEALAPYSSILISPNGSFHEYSVAATIKKSVAEGTSFDLHLFFGPVKDDNYLGAANRVGGFSVSQSGSSHMSSLVSGSVPITDALLNKLISGNIKDLEPDTVKAYVNARLVWRLVTTDGEDIGGDATSNGLGLDVQHTIVTPKAEAAAPPTVAAPEKIADTTNNTKAKPLPSGVAATTLASVAADSVPTNV